MNLNLETYLEGELRREWMTAKITQFLSANSHSFESISFKSYTSFTRNTGGVSHR